MNKKELQAAYDKLKENHAALQDSIQVLNEDLAAALDRADKAEARLKKIYGPDYSIGDYIICDDALAHLTGASRDVFKITGKVEIEGQRFYMGISPDGGRTLCRGSMSRKATDEERERAENKACAKEMAKAIGDKFDSGVRSVRVNLKSDGLVTMKALND